MKIMFTGHRNCITDTESIERIIDQYGLLTWIHGGAIGFDTQIEQIAKDYGIHTEIHKPDYTKYPSKAAPIIRNKEMLECASIVVACYDGRKSGGTAMVINEAKKQNKRIILVPAHHYKSTRPG